MSDALTGSSAEAIPRFRVREVRDRRLLDAEMADDRAFAAYAVAHLEYGLFESAHFWVADGPSGTGLVMQSADGLGRALVTVGDAAALDAILALHPGPRTNYLTTAAPAHLPVLGRYYDVEGALQMRRMLVTASEFVPAAGAVRRLHGDEVRALNALYATEGGPAGYSARHIEQGVYFGAYEAGRLVAVAGTHVVAPNTGIAVVGNVFTYPAFRGRGLATRVTSAVTEELLNRGCSLVVLTVNPVNTPAVRAYRRLGYTLGTAVVEARLKRRDMFGLGAAMRRWIARRATHDGEPGDEEAPGRPPYGPAGRGPH